MIYFDGANDYWTSSVPKNNKQRARAHNTHPLTHLRNPTSPNRQSGACGSAAMTDLWLNNAPAFGENNSYACSQGHQPASCVYEDAMFLQQTLAAIKNRDASRPYFQIWAPHNIHAPLQVPAAYLNNFSFIGDPRRQAYAAKVRYIDDALAQVVAALKAAGMWENLLFVLTADSAFFFCAAKRKRAPLPQQLAPPLTPNPTFSPFAKQTGARFTTMAAPEQTIGH